MVTHLVRMIGITGLVVLCIVYPFLPGQYDSLAVALSTMAQVFGTLGLLFVPVGGLWLAYELRKRVRKKGNLPVRARGHFFALASISVLSFVAVAVALVAFATVGPSLGLLTLAGGLYVVLALIKRVRLLNTSEGESVNPAPLYLLLVPTVVLLFQLMVAAPATAFSRNQAIANSAELITGIEAYRARHGYYPRSLLAVWKAYYPSIVGIEKFHYAPNGNAYDLFFEQPRFLLDNLGTREFVVYNRLDEQVMVSHTAWILSLRPDELARAQGWYAVHATSQAHWKVFWFD